MWVERAGVAKAGAARVVGYLRLSFDYSMGVRRIPGSALILQCR
jgi:hypothetical protein